MRKTIPLILLLNSALAGIGISQAIRFQPQKPHADVISSVVFSPDSKMLATVDERGEVILWAVPGGQIIRNFTDRQVLARHLAFSADGKYLLAAGEEGYGNYGEVTAWNVREGKKIFTVNAYHMRHVIVKPDGTGFYALGIDDGYERKLICRLYDFKGALKKETSIKGEFYEIARSSLSPDGNLLGLIMGEGAEQSVTVVDLQKQTFPGIFRHKYASAIRVTNNGEWVVGYVDEDKYTTEKCDVSTGKFSAATSPAVEQYDMLYYTSGKDKMYDVYSPKKQKIYNLRLPDLINFYNLRQWAVSPDGKYLATAVGWRSGTYTHVRPEYQALFFWNIENGKIFWGTDCNFSPVHAIDSYNDSKLVMSKKGPMEVWDPGRHDVYTEFPGGTEECLRLFADQKSFAVFTMQHYMSDYASLVNPGKESVESFCSACKVVVSSDFNMGVRLPLGSMERTAVEFFDPMTLREKGSVNLRSPIFNMAIGADGKLCALLHNLRDSIANVVLVETFSKKILTNFDISMGNRGMINADRLGMQFSDDGKFLFVSGSSRTFVYDIRLNAVVKEFRCNARRESYNPIAVHPKSKMIAFTSRNGDLLIYGGAKWEFIAKIEGGNGNISAMTYINDGNGLAASYFDGSVRIFDLNKNTLSATFLGVGDGEYLLFTPDGYYTGSGKGLNLAGFYQGNKYISWQNLDAKFNRPDTVMTRIGIAGSRLLKMYGTASEKRLQRIPVSEANLSSASRPYVRIQNKDQFPFVAENSSLSLKIIAVDSLGSLSQLRIFQNGVLVKTLDISGKSKEVDYVFNIRPGSNKLEIMVVNAEGVESPYDVFETYSEAKNQELPQLYLLAVGVSEFSEKERNLDFAAKDASEIADILKNSPAFSKTNIVLLKNKEVTLANFEKQLSFLQKAKEGDVVIMYFSTHGVLDDKMDYYLATHDMVFTEPGQKGIPYYKLEEVMGKLACHNRMIIMDACHSGEVDKEEATLVAENKKDGTQVTAKSGAFSVKPKMGLRNSFTYMHALFDDASRSCGTHIIGAASGYQVALESGEWSNGAFTYALKAALFYKAADEDKDSQVSVSELQQYVTKTVPVLTNGEQTPALRSVNHDNDFRLW